MRPSKPALSLLLILVVALGLSAISRISQHRRVQFADRENWVTTDADSLYHMRRVQRALDEESVAGSDEYLNYPDGSAIPWPPYYAQLGAALLSPFAPEDAEARRIFIEEAVATLPLIFGILATLVAACAGFLLAGRAGALVAGTYHALCHVGIAYSKLGNGDHHSFVSLVSGLTLLVVTWALVGNHLQRPRAATGLGVLVGALVGVLLGTWVGGMMYVVQLEILLGWLILRQSREPRAGLAHFGLGLHVAALMTLLPAVLASPWRETQPWIAVNISLFQPAFLALAGAVFVPLFFLRAGSSALRRYPWIVAVVLAGLGCILAFADIAAARGLREGFAWASKTNEFMAGIKESRSLLALDADPSAVYELGWALWLLPLVWAAAAWQALRRGRGELLIWIIALPLLGLQAAQQARFAESLVLPLAVVLGWGAARLLSLEGQGPIASVAGKLRRVPGIVAALAGLSLVSLCHASSVALTLGRLGEGPQPALRSSSVATIATRRMAEWIRQNTPSPADYCVLANWGAGHTIEWAADRPTVATNFGSYVGVDSYRDPSRFFMEEDPGAAQALLERRRARYVLLTSEHPDHLNSMIALSSPERRGRWVGTSSADEGRVLPGWFRTIGARLMFDGAVFRDPSTAPLDFMRIVHISPLRDPNRSLRGPADISPAGWVWERVAGARIEAQGAPGEEFELSIDIAFPTSRRPVRWAVRAQADEAGRIRLRAPYATLAPNGDGIVRSARWTLGSRGGELRITEDAVLQGQRVVLP